MPTEIDTGSSVTPRVQFHRAPITRAGPFTAVPAGSISEVLSTSQYLAVHPGITEEHR
jgi:hypothetical protein